MFIRLSQVAFLKSMSETLTLYVTYFTKKHEKEMSKDYLY